MTESGMTGRDLVLYILQNHLEDEPVFKDGKFMGFVTPEEVAVKCHVGTATVHAWIHQGRLASEAIREGIYIPATAKTPVMRVV